MEENQLKQMLADITDIKERLAKAEQIIARRKAERDDTTHRDDMAQDGKIDNFDTITKEQAQRIIQSFDQNYDTQMVANIEQTRKTAPNHKQVQKYDKAKELVAELKVKYEL